jgi:2,3-bisphosphoglycerate-dependent phosphoglycerate mutase
VPAGALPATECLADVAIRLLPYYEDVIAPSLLEGRNVVVIGHGNSLRALAMYLEDISEEDIVGLNIPTGVPRRYDLGPDLTVKSAGYLGDADAAQAAAEKVRRQAEAGPAAGGGAPA